MLCSDVAVCSAIRLGGSTLPSSRRPATGPDSISCRLWGTLAPPSWRRVLPAGPRPSPLRSTAGRRAALVLTSAHALEACSAARPLHCLRARGDVRLSSELSPSLTHSPGAAVGHCVHRDIASIGTLRPSGQLAFGPAGHRASSPSGQLAIGPARLSSSRRPASGPGSAPYRRWGALASPPWRHAAGRAAAPSAAAAAARRAVLGARLGARSGGGARPHARCTACMPEAICGRAQSCRRRWCAGRGAATAPCRGCSRCPCAAHARLGGRATPSPLVHQPRAPVTTPPL
jgi:hypothetical protein